MFILNPEGGVPYLAQVGQIRRIQNAELINEVNERGLSLFSFCSSLLSKVNDNDISGENIDKTEDGTTVFRKEGHTLRIKKSSDDNETLFSIMLFENRDGKEFGVFCATIKGSSSENNSTVGCGMDLEFVEFSPNTSNLNITCNDGVLFSNIYVEPNERDCGNKTYADAVLDVIALCSYFKGFLNKNLGRIGDVVQYAFGDKSPTPLVLLREPKVSSGDC